MKRFIKYAEIIVLVALWAGLMAVIYFGTRPG